MMKRVVFLAVVAAVLPVASANALTPGDLFVADHGAILELAPDGTFVRSFRDPSVIQLSDLAFGNSRTILYATDVQAHDVKMFDASGAVVGSFGSAYLAVPRGLAVAPNNEVWVADVLGNVEVFDAAGVHLRSIPFSSPINLAFSSDGSRVYVSQNAYSGGVHVIEAATGVDLGIYGDTATAVVLASGLAVAPDGTLYVGDGAFGGGSDSIKVFAPGGAFAGTLAEGFSAPFDLTIDGAGNVWTTNTNNFDGDRVDAFAPSGTVLARIAGDEFLQPTGLTFLLPAAIPAPVASAGADQVVECGRSITLDGTASRGDHLTYTWRAADGSVVGTSATLTLTLAPGTYSFTLTVTDTLGRSAADTVAVRVADTAAPSLAVSVSRPVLWPPEHQLVGEVATATATDRCDAGPQVQLVSITSSEPDQGLGDGDTANDIQGAALGTDDRSFSLRAERSGQGDGRTYVIVYSARDAAGNTATASATVVVPHSG